jgi:hypothetical protein
MRGASPMTPIETVGAPVDAVGTARPHEARDAPLRLTRRWGAATLGRGWRRLAPGLPAWSDVSPSDIAFLALGLVLGAAVGAAIVEVVHARPAPRREVRLTIAPNSIHARQGATLADPRRVGDRPPIPGSPEDGAWPQTTDSTLEPAGPPTPDRDASIRTPVPSAPFELSEQAVAIPVQRADPVQRPIPIEHGGAAAAPLPPPLPPRPTVPSQPLAPRPPGAQGTGPDGGPSGGPTAQATGSRTGGTTALLDRPAIPRPVVAAGAATALHEVRTRPPVEPAPVRVPSSAVGILDARESSANRPVTPEAARADGGSLPGARSSLASVQPGASADPCGALRTLVDERCAVATSARQHAQSASDTLREAQRAYDAMRERVERAQAQADPRAVAAAKEALHGAFRAASAAAAGAEATERAAREWLDRINELNAQTREATRLAESGLVELRSSLPRLERLTVEADAARITAESAELACHEAREALAACEEPSAEAAIAAASAASATSGEPAWPLAATWPPNVAQVDQPGDEAAVDQHAGLPVIIRILDGDLDARDRLVASLAEDDPTAARQWQIRLAGLTDAIGARAIEDGFLDLPDLDPFWGLFSVNERREIVGALSALGFRFDGLGGFADERVPATRDLSLAVGYAGLDRMRIRAWPRETELSTLYSRASVAAGEWLAHEAGDLSLGVMVDALGARASDLADLWNAWGRLRPALLATT